MCNVLLPMKEGARRRAREASRGIEPGHADRGELRSHRAAGDGLPQRRSRLRVPVGQGCVLELPQQLVDVGFEGVQRGQRPADRVDEGGAGQRVGGSGRLRLP